MPLPDTSASRPFAAVIFDCDGVLVDSETLALEIEMDALGRLGMTYGHDEFCARFMGLNNPAFYAALNSDRLATQGVALPEDFADQHRARMWDAYANRLEIIPGALEAVAECDLPKAVASSSGGGMLALKLERTGLDRLFGAHIYGGNLVKNAKPAPDLFLLAAAGLGVDPRRCLVLEDTENGVRAGVAAGMTVWGFTGGGHMRATDGDRLTAAGAERLVTDWREAGEIFRDWTRQGEAASLEA